MVNFGERLDLSMYAPWREYYLDYNRFKRIIARNRFLTDKFDRKNEKDKIAIKDSVGQDPSKVGDVMRLMNPHQTVEGDEAETETEMFLEPPSNKLRRNLSAGTLSVLEELRESLDAGKVLSPLEDFFAILRVELIKINKFYTDKVQELRAIVDEVLDHKDSRVNIDVRQDVAEVFKKLRGAYLELTQLESFKEFNQTGVLKIVKKHDKVMKTTERPNWEKIVLSQNFVISQEPAYIMEKVTSIVGDEKLLEWDSSTKQDSGAESEQLFPRIRPVGIAIALSLFSISLYFPLKPDDPAISNCTSLLV